MRILIGYSMRSGSTLLQHLLNEHQVVRSFSDLSSLPVLGGMVLGIRPDNICIKPPDMLYLWKGIPLLNAFDKRVWLVRDPRDSYLSTIESGYAYLFWRRGRMEQGIDTGLIRRWRRIQRHYFRHPEGWHLVRYEDLTTHPVETMRSLFAYFDLEFDEDILNFRPFTVLSGGDMKLAEEKRVHRKSVARHLRQMTRQQRGVFEQLIGKEMLRLGYDPSPAAAESAPAEPAKEAAMTA